MAVGDLLRKFKFPSKILPKGVLRRIEVMLTNAKISFSAQEWMGIFSILAVLTLLAGSIAYSNKAGVAGFFAWIFLMFIIPKMLADKRRAKVEEALPDALHHMAVAIRSGLVLESVVVEVAKANYGALSEEFDRITIEIRKGRPLKEALLSFAKRMRSPQVKRAITLLVEGMEAGGSVPDVLEEVAEDLRAIRAIQRERKSLTGQQISFLVMASAFAGPFVMGVVATLPKILAGAGYSGPLKEINLIITALSFYVVAQACAASIMMSIVMYGNAKKSLKFMIPMAIVSFGVFNLVQKMIPGMLKIF